MLRVDGVTESVKLVETLVAGLRNDAMNVRSGQGSSP